MMHREKTPPTSLCIGAVVPLTGRLAPLGTPLSFVLRALAPRLARLHGGGRRRVRIAVRDSRSDPAAARLAVRQLAVEERAQIVLTMAGTHVLPAVTETCEALGVPCVSTTFPWQAYVHARGAEGRPPFRWTYHFAWGLDDIAAVFAELWESAGGGTVGCLWNDDLQGHLLRRDFASAAAARGHSLVDPGAYREPAAGFRPHLDTLLAHGTELITSAATAEDLALFLREARQSGLRPRLLTCSRWLTYPYTQTSVSRQVHEELADARVATLVYWSPDHPHRSGFDGTTCADLARAYEEETGGPWLQPLGLAHALVEVAAHALSTAADPTDRAAVADAVAGSRVPTIAGVLDWAAGPTPNIALLPLAGGQWQPGPRGPRLAVVANSTAPGEPLRGERAPQSR
ncbi:ABC transporter substrate-binding protein [Streptomyces sp. MP131-18]|uniref:ABC transporter substrate-binding protein n=1 Tax=Streptomyces sp. MP131-18 TaxID=1857892 RepID=UPI0009C88277|nr:ABC transporter substrate-binding protein [Streptomyces sp. MP131-18]ONK15198.1 hypothetical protein STBA_60130 [Streptomyces sp. MP131-18]